MIYFKLSLVIASSYLKSNLKRSPEIIGFHQLFILIPTSGYFDRMVIFLHIAVINFKSMSRFVVYINGERVVTDVSANDGLWHLVCLLWSSQDGSWCLYKDGVKAESGEGLATKTSIPGKIISKMCLVEQKFSQAEAPWFWARNRIRLGAVSIRSKVSWED